MNISLPRDNNRITTLGGTSNADGVTPVAIYADPVTHRLLVDLAGTPGTGTVTSVSVVSANGFAGTVATATTTPAITLSTTVTGLLKGNGTAISAAVPDVDYLVDITGLIVQGTDITITGTGTSGDPYIINSTPGATGITSINGDTTAAQILDNVDTFIDITQPVAGTNRFAINIGNLTSDSTFISDIVNIVNTDPTISIDLTSQVTGILPIANGGTNSGIALSGSTIMISDGTSIVQGSAGTTTTVLHGNASGAPTYSAVDLTTDVTGLLPSSNIDITDLESTLDLSNIAGQIDLTTQVSGVLPLANGGTASVLTDPNYNALMGWDDTDNEVGFWHLGSGLLYDHTSHTLSVIPSTLTVNDFDDFTSNNQIVAGGSSSNSAVQSGNFAYGNSTQLLTTETNHPGIVSTKSATQLIAGFGYTTITGANQIGITKGQISLSNDFNIEFLNRLKFAGATSGSFLSWLIGYTGGQAILVQIDITNSIFTPTLIVNASSVSFTTPTKPTDLTWFRVIFNYTAGILTVTFNGTVMYSNAVSFASNDGNIQVFGASGSKYIDVDYIQTSYTVTR